MRGDPGPYMSDDGGIWVPRTVPWKEARRVAATADPRDPWLKLKYVGKEDATLTGFARDCECEEVCCGAVDEEGSCQPIPECRVPTYRFQLEEVR